MELTNLTGEEMRDLCRRHGLRGHSYYTKVAQLVRFIREHDNYEAVRAELEKIAAGDLPRPRARKSEQDCDLGFVVVYAGMPRQNNEETISTAAHSKTDSDCASGQNNSNNLDSVGGVSASPLSPAPAGISVNFVPSPSLPLPPATPNPEDEGDEDDEPIRLSPPSQREMLVESEPARCLLCDKPVETFSNSSWNLKTPYRLATQCDCRISKSDSNLKPKERPILFSGKMVRAILSGSKTQTRRVVKPQPETCLSVRLNDCPYGQPGDRLWVRETWNKIGDLYAYAADHVGFGGSNIWPWKPSIHMPYSACRLKLQVNGIGVQRLQDISEEDAIAEGCPGGREEFQKLWDEINAGNGYRWSVNPWVWAIEFVQIEIEEDLEDLDDCPTCDGIGEVDDFTACPDCGGDGFLHRRTAAQMSFC